MKLSSIISASILAFSSLVNADSEDFGLIAIRSGSDLQYAGIFSQNGTLYFGHVGNSSLSGRINDCGQLVLADNSSVVINNDGSLEESDDLKKATDGFAIQDGHLLYKQDNDEFFAVPQAHDSSIYLVSTKRNGNESLSVVIRAQGYSGDVAHDFHATKNCSTSVVGAEMEISSYTTIEPTSTQTWIAQQNKARVVNVYDSFGLGFGFRAFDAIAALLS